MKKVTLLVAAALLSTLSCFSAFAGTSTTVSPDGKVYDSMALY